MSDLIHLIKSTFSNKAETVKEALIKSSIINLFARGFGYLKHLSIAYLLGFSFQTDAVFMALSLLGIFLMFVDVFDSIGVPNLVKARLESKEEFYKLSGLLFTFTIFLTLLITILAIISYPLIKLVPFGFKKEALSYLKVSYFFLIPYLSLSFLFHHFGAVLRSLRRFTQYFIGEFIFSFFTFIFITLGLLFWKDYRVIPISLSLSQILATLYMFFVGKEFIHLKFYYDKRASLIVNHFFYLSALYGVFHLFILVNRAFASLLGEKAISALTYGFLVATIPRGLFKIEHMAITSLSEAGGSIYKLNFYIKKIFQLTFPMMLFFFIFSEILVKLLFHYGAFTRQDVELTSLATRFYALSLPFFFLWSVIYRVFQILNWLKPVFGIAILAVLFNIVLNYIFVVILKLGIPGICTATFINYVFLCSFSYLILKLNFEKIENKI